MTGGGAAVAIGGVAVVALLGSLRHAIAAPDGVRLSARIGWRRVVGDDALRPVANEIGEPRAVELIADRVCMLDQGKVAALGTLEEVQNSSNPFVKRFFGRVADEDDGDSEDYIESLTSRKP